MRSISVCVMPPLVTRTTEPIPLRLDFVPTNFKRRLLFTGAPAAASCAARIAEPPLLSIRQVESSIVVKRAA